MLFPSFVTIGPITLHFYGLMYALAAVCAFFVTRWLARKKHDPLTTDNLIDVIFWTMLGGVIGGRIFYAVVYNPEVYLADPLEIIKVWRGGMSIHGGLLGGFFGLLFAARQIKRPIAEIADLFLPALALGLAFGRFGNFVNGELVGRVTDLTWGIDFGDGNNRHPSQLYAMAKDILLFLIFFVLVLRTSWRAGILSGLFFCLYAVFRFVVEFFRAPDAQVGFLTLGLSMGQWLSILLFVVGAGIMTLYGYLLPRR